MINNSQENNEDNNNSRETQKTWEERL